MCRLPRGGACFCWTVILCLGLVRKKYMKTKTLMLSICGVLVCASSVHAESLVALTVTNKLLRFGSATPGTITNTASISGLMDGDVLAGIDLRPANNTLYGFTTDAGLGASAQGVGRVYSINPTTGAATLSATLSADVADT